MSPAELAEVEGRRKTVTPSEIRQELGLALASSQFAKAEKLAALLTYLCENSISGNASALKESVLAVEVFHRNTAYSPAEDSIVRVQAYELRRRLREYYAADGRDRPIRIEIPRGSYCPKFVRVAATPMGVLSVPASPGEPVPLRRASRFVWPMLLAVLLVSLGYNLWLVVPRLLPSPSRRANATPQDYRGYLDMFTVNGKALGTLVCLSNPEVLLVDGAHTRPPASFVAHETIPLKGVIRPDLRPRLPYVWLHPTSDEYTGMGEAACAYHLGRLMQALNLPERLTQDRFLNWDRATHDGIVVLGLPYSNQWTRTNFSSRLFQNTDAGLKITGADAERADYGTTFDPATGRVVADHGVISREQTASGGFVVTLAGRTSYGTYGVGEFFCDPNRMNPVFQKLRATAKNGSLPHNFVVLLKVDVSDNIPAGVSLVTLHAQP